MMVAAEIGKTWLWKRRIEDGVIYILPLKRLGYDNFEVFKVSTRHR
jgi:hypothetical protein